MDSNIIGYLCMMMKINARECAAINVIPCCRPRYAQMASHYRVELPLLLFLSEYHAL